MSRRDEFIKDLIKKDFIEYGITFNDRELSDYPILVLGFKEGCSFNEELETLLENYQESYEDIAIFDSCNGLEKDKEILKELEDVIEYKVIGKDLLVREYNKLLNEEDLKPHDSVGLCILDGIEKKILVLDHIKFDMITVPVGKVKEGQNIYEAIKEELEEETGIIVNEATEIAQFDTHAIRNDVIIDIHNHLFVCCKNDVDLTNMGNKEPQKHRDMFWMDLEQLKELETRSFMTNVFISMLRDDLVKFDVGAKWDEFKEFRTAGIRNYIAVQIHTDDKKHKFKDLEYVFTNNQFPSF